MKPNKLSVFALAMINVALIMSLRGLPMMAKEGLSMVFYILFAAILFLLPVSLVSAELASGWPENGGVYRWVKEAFGPKLGFTAIWLQWIQNTIWFPTVLAFAAAALAYLFVDPTLASNKLYNLIVILAIYWGATFVTFSGMKTSSWVTTAGVIIGTLFPGILIIILGFFWVAAGHPIEFLKVPHSFFPNFTNFSSLAFLGGITLLFAGMEVGAVHIKELKNPKKDYPKAVFISLIIIAVIFFLGSFAIASSIPHYKISLTAGIMEGFKDMLHMFKLDWALPIMGLFIAFGAIGGVTAWIGGPSKGLLATAKDGDLPPFLQYTNKKGVQTHILWIQGIIVTILSLVFVLMPNVSAAFFLLTALTATLYLIMYLLLYAAAIRLKYSQPNVERSYKVPGGKIGMWITAGIGLIAVLFAIVVSFFPPSLLKIGSSTFYVLFMVIGTIIFVGLPILINHFKRKSWIPTDSNKGE
jgi:glutamate:GABA antiporter